ncbi:hypothetical protein IAT38_000792 [Cryptococcus sp. DSM 104549]
MLEDRKPYRNGKQKRGSNPAIGRYYRDLYSKPKFFAVKRGRQTGVFRTWRECRQQVDGFKGAIHARFNALAEAEEWLAGAGVGTTPSTSQAIVVSDGEDDIVITGSSFARGAKRKAGWPAGSPRDEKKPALERETINLVNQEDRHVPLPNDPLLPLDGPLLPLDDPLLPLGDPLLPPNNLPPPTGSPGRPVGEEPVLSTQQSQILKRIIDGENFFFTGSAGTGKSVLLRAIIQAFNQRAGRGREQDYDELWEQERVHEWVPDRWELAVTASTGMAGVNIGGVTLHSWAGIGLGKDNVGVLIARIKKNKESTRRWVATSALVVDEVSMIDGALMDKLEQIARSVRRNNKVFGGIQVILSGDFFQLPPVKAEMFAFESKAWAKMFSQQKDNVRSLNRVFRQKENTFVGILENMRKGIITDEHVKILKTLARSVDYPDGVEPVGLYPIKKQVEKINQARLDALPTEGNEYGADDKPGWRAEGTRLTKAQATEALNKNTIWAQLLHLKVGAQVMLIVNMNDGVLVNGSLGVVVDFKFIDEVRKEGIPIPSSVYYPAIQEFAWPVVEFVPSKYAKSQEKQLLYLPPLTVEFLNAKGEAQATRHQVPLILAWALTIHKSQGQTIERLRVDLQGTFEDGQAYVAISRAICLETLEIRNFDRNKVRVNKKVLQWARGYEEEQAALDEWDDAH